MGAAAGHFLALAVVVVVGGCAPHRGPLTIRPSSPPDVKIGLFPPDGFALGFEPTCEATAAGVVPTTYFAADAW